MKVTPLKRYSIPEYPIQDILAAHPELLRLVPKRWANAPLVLSALSMVCLIFAACNKKPAEVRTGAVKAENPTVQSRLSATRVAPIFHHGKGRGGSFGCVATAAPMFLTEDEARQIITEEAATSDIHFENKQQVIRQFETENLTIDARTRKPKTKKILLTLDGTDPQRNISFEFVSEEDLDTWEMGKLHSSRNEQNEIEPVAEAIQKGFSKTSTGRTIGVFYDPVTYCCSYERPDRPDFPVSKNAEAAKQNSMQELKKQVHDFIVWLKSEGII